MIKGRKEVRIFYSIYNIHIFIELLSHTEQYLYLSMYVYVFIYYIIVLYLYYPSIYLSIYLSI